MVKVKLLSDGGRDIDTDRMYDAKVIAAGYIVKVDENELYFPKDEVAELFRVKLLSDSGYIMSDGEIDKLHFAANFGMFYTVYVSTCYNPETPLTFVEDDVMVIPESGMRVRIKEEIEDCYPWYVTPMRNMLGKIHTVDEAYEDGDHVVFTTEESESYRFNAKWIDSVVDRPKQLFVELLDTDGYIGHERDVGKLHPAVMHDGKYSVNLRTSGDEDYYDLIFYADSVQVIEPGHRVKLKPADECELYTHTTVEMLDYFDGDVTIRTVRKSRDGITFRIKECEGIFHNDWIDTMLSESEFISRYEREIRKYLL